MNKLLGYIQTQTGSGTMKRKLFLYMLLLLLFILLVLASMLSLMGQFKTPKDSLLETCELSVKEAAELICARTGAQSVQMIGRKIVFFRQASEKEKRKIKLAAQKK